MRALIFGEKTSYIVDGLGFIQALSSALNEDYQVDAVTIASADAVKDQGIRGIDNVYLIDRSVTETISKALHKIYEKDSPDIVIGSSTKNTTEILSRLAAKEELPMITEVAAISKADGNVYLEKPIMGARALAVYAYTEPILATVPSGKFKAELTGAEPMLEELKIGGEARIKSVEVLPKEKGAVDIEAAEIVVGVGRGFRDKNDLDLAFNVAKLVDGEVGCTRPIAADYKWLGEDRWIGISGKKIRGKLYMAIGISGAPQHIMAAMDTKLIVVVNKDKNAPIFQYSDYGVVADLYKFLPVFIEKLKERLAK